MTEVFRRILATADNVRVLQAVAAFFVLIKLVYVFFAGPIADEAYYWDWGLHPSLSYFDHPPFQAWMLGLSHLLFGRSLLALRWLTLATMVATFYIYSIWAKRLVPGPGWRLVFWRGVVIYLASTTFGFFTSLAMHDYMLVFLCLLSGHFFISYLSDFRERGAGRLTDLYLGAFFLGLSVLTKYNGLFLGVGLALYIVSSRPLRPLMRSIHLWLAALLAILMQAPVLIWNYMDGFRPILFHLSDRHPTGWLERLNSYTLADFLAVSALLVSPFLIVPFGKVMLSRPDAPFERTARGLATFVFWSSTLCFLVVSMFDQVWWWWNMVAYVLLLPLAARTISRWLLIGHVLLGAGIGLFLLVSSAIVPVTLLWGVPDGTRGNLYGWDLIEAPVRAAQAAYPTQFVATLGSEVGGITAFALDDPSVAALTPWHNQFDYWFDAPARLGQNAIVVMKEGEDEQFMATMFRSMTLLESIPIERFGYRIGTYEIYYAEGFAGLR